MEGDYLSVLGMHWDEPPLRSFVASLGISGAPTLPVDPWTYLINYKLGIELTFTHEDSLAVRLREYPLEALVLLNIRFYVKKERRYRPFKGQLPLGLWSDATKESLIKELGPPDWDDPDISSLRWDRDGYCVFAVLSQDGTLSRLSLQLPVRKPPM